MEQYFTVENSRFFVILQLHEFWEELTSLDGC